MGTYLVTQATGQQSRAVIKHLLASGAKVHAVVRDLTKELPADLKHNNIKLFQGESKTFDDIYVAAQGCKGVFLNTYPIPGLESLQAKTIVEACKKAGVESVVGSSTIMTNNKSHWDNDEIKAIQLHGYWASKYELEGIVRSSGFSKGYTIVRPGVIHFGLFLPGSLGNFPRLSTHAEIDDLLQPDRSLSWTDCDDIGRYAAAALLDPVKYSGQELDLVNAVFGYEELCAIVRRVSGREVHSVKRTWEELGEIGAQVWGQRFQLMANLKDWSYVVENAKAVEEKFGLKFTSFEDALIRDKAQLLAGLPKS
jgi:uncharacterized protein YbjT (DUF2867 family)